MTIAFTGETIAAGNAFTRERVRGSSLVRMLYRIIFPMCTLLLFANELRGDDAKMQARLWMLEKYEHIDADNIADSVTSDLLSPDALIQDAGCLLLLKALEGNKRKEAKSDTIFTRLAADQNVVAAVSDIVDARLAGWYNPAESEEIDDDLAVYVPLLFILGKADSKVARHTLSRSFLYLREHPEITELLPVNEGMMAFTLNRLQVIKGRNCCMYPGKELLVDMLEKDYRFGLLEMYRKYLAEGNRPNEAAKKEMKAFVNECMNYGDGKNGYVIRTLAAKVAGLLIASGEADLLAKIQAMAENDPFYVHVHIGRFGYSLTELNYPVREACRKLAVKLTEAK